jgi:hypothetical protein
MRKNLLSDISRCNGVSWEGSKCKTCARKIQMYYDNVILFYPMIPPLLTLDNTCVYWLEEQ